MPSILTSTETELGGATLPNCDSRSLRLTRYARPELNDKSTPSRRDFLANVTTGSRDTVAATAYLNWVKTLPTATLIHARLEARLLLNMAGSVLENAGLNLDRYGIVTIPGSAIKACARRAALATLRQWCETGQKPLGDDLLAPAAASFADDKPGDLLLAILRVFGCTDLEWGRYDPAPKSKDKNDLAWACGDDLPAERNHWPTLHAAARKALNSDTNIPDEKAPTRRGTIAFLPAYPIPSKLPKPDLELDVLTPHHKKYYESKDPDAVALDTEDPVPVFFPAVAAETTYSFTLLLVGTKTDAKLLNHAATWLLTGLTTFGLGAKTAAGYGWFKDATTDIVDAEAKEAEAKRKAAEDVAAKAKHEAELAARKTRLAAYAQMSPAEQADADLAAISTDWGRLKQHLDKLFRLDAKEAKTAQAQAAALRWFDGAGRERWLTEIKPDSAKGKKPWSQIIVAVHAAKKTHKIDLP